MSIAQLFSGVNFEQAIKRYARDHRWDISEIDNSHAIMKFKMDSGHQQIPYTMRYESTLEFSVPSILQFDDEDEIPHYFSTLLLRQNSQTKIGF